MDLKSKATITPVTKYDIKIGGTTYPGCTKVSEWNGMVEYETNKDYGCGSMKIIISSVGSPLSEIMDVAFCRTGQSKTGTVEMASPLIIDRLKNDELKANAWRT